MLALPVYKKLSCTRVRLPPDVNDTMAGAKWANHLVALQDNELILIYLSIISIYQSNQSIQYTLYHKTTRVSTFTLVHSPLLPQSCITIKCCI